MKHFLSLAKAIAIALASAIKRGIIRIFPRASHSVSVSDSILPFTYRTFATTAIAFAIAFALIGCATPKHVTQLVERVSVDTIYLNKMQFDSIYIYQEHNVLPLSDSIHLPFNGEDGRGLYIKDKSIEYRYKLLRDTVKVIQRDSIPYEVIKVETKEITRPLTFFDYLCRYSFYFLLGIFFYLAYTRIRQFKKGCC